MKLKLFNIELGQETKSAIFDRLETVLRQKKSTEPFFLSTLNPEILLQAEKDFEYAKILNSTTLKINDGFGLQLLACFKKQEIGQRLAGADLAGWILQKTKELGLRVGLAVNKNGLSSQQEIENYLKKQKVENFVIFSQEKNFFLQNQVFPADFLESEVLLVGLGAPEQEKFIFQAIQKRLFPNLKLAIGVGGTFDFWTKKQKRAPIFFQKMGLEWLWRLFFQPRRIFRIWRATAVFFWKGISGYNS